MAIAPLYRGEIKAALPPLREGVTIERVLNQIDAAIRELHAEWGENHGKDTDLLDTHRINNPFKPYPSKIKAGRRVSAGPPRRTEEQRFIERCATIYERATRQRVGHRAESETKDPKKTRPPKDKPHLFLLACMRAAGICAGPKDWPGYPSWVVRKAIKHLYPEAKAGRPKNRRSQ
jgi:hypothetical protein